MPDPQPSALRLKLIAPIALPDDQLAWRAGRYRELAAAVGGLVTELVNLTGPDAPPSLDSDDAVAASIELVRAEMLRTDPARHDVVLPDCVLDPGVGPGAPVPAVGIGQLVTAHLAALGQTFSAVTRNEPIAREFTRRVGEYGLRASFLGVDVIDGDLALVSDHDEWMRRLQQVCAGPRAQQAGVVFNGCSAVAVDRSLLRGVRVVDPTPMALRLLRVAADAGVLPLLAPAPAIPAISKSGVP